MRSPLRVTVFSPSTYTGATGRSPVPGRLMPMLACLLSPGPFTTQPITATVMSSTPAYSRRQCGMRTRMCDWMRAASSWKRVLVARPQPGHATPDRAAPHVRQALQRHDAQLSAVPARGLCQGHAYGVADAFLQDHRHAGGG